MTLKKVQLSIICHAVGSLDCNDCVSDLSDVAVFSGRLSMACEPTEAGVVRSGYCAVRAPRPKEVQLFGSQGLQMRVKTDGRMWGTIRRLENFILCPYAIF